MWQRSENAETIIPLTSESRYDALRSTTSGERNVSGTTAHMCIRVRVFKHLILMQKVAHQSFARTKIQQSSQATPNLIKSESKCHVCLGTTIVEMVIFVL